MDTQKKQTLEQHNVALKIQLAKKAKELKIETALEKVRVIALKMKAPADMLKICKTISKQLTVLGIKEIRNVQTAIFDEDRKRYMNYEYYAKHDKTIITETTYSNNEIHNAFANQMLKGNGEFFITHIKGDEVKDWIAYQKSTNVFIDKYLSTASSLNYYWYSLGAVALGISTYEPLKEEDINLFKRFLKVFELSYTRYLDIEQAIAQAREAQIQLALERVRARTMAMQKSEELSETVFILFQQFKELGEKPDQATIGVINEDEKVIEYWVTMYGNQMNRVFKFSIDEPHVTNKIYKAWKKNKTSIVIDLSGKELNEFAAYRESMGGAAYNPKEKHRIINVAFFSKGLLNVQSTEERSEESIRILERFASVFEQTYTRFLDLQKAEAQAREAQIELGLERVRAKAMAMQTSEELNALIGIVFTELTKLDLVLTRCVIIIYDAETKGAQWWMANSEAPSAPMNFFVKYANLPFFNRYRKGWKERDLKWQYILEGENKIITDNFLFNETELKTLPDFVIEGMKAPQKVYLNASFNNFGNLTLATLEPLSENHFDILLRFAKVFDLTYTRFNDLQKAEAQARESQIQLALERVRARTMAMQKSEELKEVIQLILEQFVHLGLETEAAGFMMEYKESNDINVWVSSPRHPLATQIHIPYFDHPIFKLFIEAKEKGFDFYTVHLSKEEKDTFFTHLFQQLPEFPVEWKQEMYAAPGYVDSHVMLNNIALYIQNYTGIPYSDADNAILMRFAKAFEQTYTRFLDLQKAEAQAREAQIELGLERVRARAMAMQKSDELSELVDTVFKELTKLDFALTWCIINIIDESSMSNTVWAANPDINKAPESYHMLFEDYPFHHAMMKGWKERKTKDVYVLGGNEKKIYDEYLFNETEFRRVPAAAQAASRAMEKYVVTFSFSNFGGLQTVGDVPLSDVNLDILSRFGKVFDLTYTRFNDLKQAEAQARESQIEASLERVRSRSMGMQKSEELKEVIQVVYEQLVHLNILVEHAGFIMDYKERDDMYIWLADKHEIPSQVTIPYFDSLPNNSIKEAKEKGKDFFEYLLNFEEKNKFYQDLFRFVPDVPEESLEYYFNCPGLAGSGVLLDNVGLYIENFDGIPYTDEENKILMRFGKVFQQTYTRFLDLQKAETQVREAQIQLALERVRAKSLAMHHSSELQEVVNIVAQQLHNMNVDMNGGVFICINKEVDKDAPLWAAAGAAEYVQKVIVPDTAIPIISGLRDAIKKGNNFLEEEFSNEEKKEFFRQLFKHEPWKSLAEERKKELLSREGGYTRSVAVMQHTSIAMINHNGKKFSDDENEILKRFGNVFEQSYVRFLDLKKAEAQAREAEIELGLERVRSRAMAMHKSEELQDVIMVVSDQLQHLGFRFHNVSFVRYNEKNGLNFWLSSPGQPQPYLIQVPYLDNPVFNRPLEAIKKGIDFMADVLTPEDNHQWLKHLIENSVLKNVSAEDKKALLGTQGYARSVVITKNIILVIGNYASVPYSDDQNAVLKKVGNVFEQAHTRFLDLQKAEAQAKEAKIEAALERVRSKTMAMHNSADVGQTVAVLFNELKKLGIETIRCGIGIMQNTKKIEVWTAKPNENDKTDLIIGHLDMNLHPLLQGAFNGWSNKKESFSYELKEDDLINYFTAINNHPEYPVQYNIATLPSTIYHNDFFFSEGTLFAFSVTQLSDESKKICKRFAGVFGQTYRRYLDLQKAEAQAREAQIEAALERVRSKAMAMHNSKHLAETINVFYREIELLSVTPRRCGVGLLNKESHVAEISTMSTTEDGKPIEVTGELNLEGHTVLEGIYNNWLKQKEYRPVLRGNEIKEYYQLIRPHIPYPDYPNDVAQYGYFFYFPEGGVFAWTEKELAEDELQIYRRFTSVLSLTYKRYKDLQTAEANAKEAIKQAALDRIRADIASMRTVNDLDRITPLIWNELNILGVPFIRCGVFIMNDDQQLIHTFLSTPNGKAIAAFHIPYHTPGNIKHVISHWRNNKNYIDHWDEDAFTEFANMLVTQGALTSSEQYLQTIPHGGFYLHFLPFLQGMLYVGNTTKLSDDEINLIQSIADAFSTAYARYEDFNKLEAAKKQVDRTLIELKQTQQQLVQSEKMASLGELTAGIAHEIQNPLNFVNNFSDVNAELIDELKTELATGNQQQAIEIADDIKENEQKINHHGKRADAIIKGMLQHSRKSSGQKEPTDINALADEYLRLSFHGLRAKDKNFNADFKTDFDDSIGKINVVPQDIGRVLLNLFNNAFYAAPLSPEGGFKEPDHKHEPTIWVKTKKEGGKVLMSVKDNGPGIPQNILDKIFQPFFTTKPTGSGTGLGLSLSYDIIKAHGGEIKVETKEGAGTEFIIYLNIN